MTISHEKIDLRTPDAPVVFSSLLDVSCSVCAPDHMTEHEVTRFANAEGPAAHGGAWIAVDKSTLGMGTPTPNPCNQVAGRRHWFFLSVGSVPR